MWNHVNLRRSVVCQWQVNVLGQEDNRTPVWTDVVIPGVPKWLDRALSTGDIVDASHQIGQISREAILVSCCLKSPSEDRILSLG